MIKSKVMARESSDGLLWKREDLTRMTIDNINSKGIPYIASCWILFIVVTFMFSAFNTLSAIRLFKISFLKLEGNNYMIFLFNFRLYREFMNGAEQITRTFYFPIYLRPFYKILAGNLDVTR